MLNHAQIPYDKQHHELNAHITLGRIDREALNEDALLATINRFDPPKGWQRDDAVTFSSLTLFESIHGEHKPLAQITFA